MSETVVCKQIGCNDYLTGEGDPAWCFRAGCPANVAMAKCPKITGDQEGRGTNNGELFETERRKNDKRTM